MSLVPAFQLGLWNAWIFLIPLLIMHIVNVRIKTGGPSVKILIVLFLILHILPVFLPLEPNTIWFYVGLVFYIVGITMLFQAIYGFATAPIDKPVRKGIFRYSRNPMYLGIFILFIGISLVSISWYFMDLFPDWRQFG